MKYKILAIVFFVIAGIALLFFVIALYSYFADHGQSSSGQAELLSGTKGIAVIGAVFFFIGRLFWKKWKQLSFKSAV